VAAPEGRYGSDGAGRATAAVCRRCGHEESLGVLYGPGFGGQVTDPAVIAELEARRARDMAVTLGSAPFPLYGLTGHRPTVVGHGRHDDELDRVSLAFDTEAGPVTVETSAEAPYVSPGWAARQVLEGLLGDTDRSWPDGSDTAVSLRLNARSRAQAAIAAAAPVHELSLPVDGAPTRFAAAAHDDRFAAVAQGLPGGLTITIGGRGSPAQLALEPVP
jgi:hypothetical protein